MPILLKLQRLHQGPMCMIEIKETNKEKIKRFVSGLRRDKQYQVEFYEYSTLENVFTLALGIEIQLKRKRRVKKSYSPNHYFSHSWKGNAKKKHTISSLLTLIKNHEVKVSHQVITFTIPLLQDQVPLNVLNVWVIITLL